MLLKYVVLVWSARPPAYCWPFVTAGSKYKVFLRFEVKIQIAEYTNEYFSAAGCKIYRYFGYL